MGHETLFKSQLMWRLRGRSPAHEVEEDRGCSLWHDAVLCGRPLEGAFCGACMPRSNLSLLMRVALGFLLMSCVVVTGARAAEPVPAAAPTASVTARLKAHPGLRDVATVVTDVVVDLKYASTDNFMRRNVYGDLRTCFLQKEAAAMLKRANDTLQKVRPGTRMLMFDCARPRSVQKIMWDVVKGTRSQSYVANPHTKTASIHNYGCAVDMGLAGPDGAPLDMGTGYDFFGRAAQPRHELTLLRKGKLTPAQVQNRVLLRHVMLSAGFYPVSNEWWHFDCARTGTTRRRYKIIE